MLKNEIIWLNKAKPNLKLLGSKAYNLVKANNNGIKVPNAFFITTKVWKKVAPHIDSVRECEKLSEENLFFLKGIQDTILNCYKKLYLTLMEDKKVIVRTSALKEDLKESSFAGQYQTVLGVNNEKELMDAVCSCWKSAKFSNVNFYSKIQRINLKQNRITLIVQQMINSEMSGVLFSANPVTGNQDHYVIEVVFGNPAEYVSGKATPVRLIIDKNKNEILNFVDYGSKTKNIFEIEMWKPLINYASKIEKLYKTPQDIEWAYNKDEYWILQTRPISKQDSGIIWTRGNIGEVLPGVVTPLTWSNFTQTIKFGEKKKEKIPPSKMIRLSQGKAYLNMNMLWDSYSNILGIDPYVVLSKGMGCDLEVFKERVKVNISLKNIIEIFVKTIYVWSEILSMNIQKPRLMNKFENYKQKLEKFRNKEINQLGPHEIWHEIGSLLRNTGHAFSLHMKSSFFAQCSYASLRNLLAKEKGEEITDIIFSTINHTQFTTNSVKFRLEKLVKKIKSSPILKNAFLKYSTNKLEGLLIKTSIGQEIYNDIIQCAVLFGDRGTQEFELSSPRWSENPTTFLITLKSLIHSNVDKSFSSKFSSIKERKISKMASNKLLTRSIINRIYKAFVFYRENREKTKLLLVNYFFELRTRYLILEDYFIKENILKKRGDIFLLKFEEIKNIMSKNGKFLKNYTIIEDRRKIHDLYCSMADTNSGKYVENTHSSLSGTGVSGGIYTGKARIVTSNNLEKLKRGEILVTEYTDPGWMPIFLTSGAIVTELGGVLSHTAILLREFEKPAIFAVENVTRIIRNGQIITVDGDKGKIYLHS